MTAEVEKHVENVLLNDPDVETQRKQPDLSVSLCLAAVCGVHREEPGVRAGSEFGQRAVQQSAGRLRQSAAVLQPAGRLTHTVTVVTVNMSSDVLLIIKVKHEAGHWLHVSDSVTMATPAGAETVSRRLSALDPVLSLISLFFL